MPLSQRRKVLWDPLGSDRFIVGSSSEIKLYQWSPQSREMRILASQSDLVNMRCFAWSPHSAIDDLVAVGMATGNVQLLRLEGATTSTPYSYYGLEAPQVSTLSTKYPRPCQALEFSSIDSNYLAVGLDKARNDASLLIWDIERSTQTVSPPDSDVSGPQRTSLKLPVTNPVLSGPGDIHPLQYYCMAESVHSISFLRGSPHLLIAGIGKKQIGMYDLRFSGTINTFSYNTGAGNNNRPVFYSTKSVCGVAIDPLDDNYLASYGDGTVINLWDRRSSSPVMTWTETDARSGVDPSTNAISMIQFSGSRRGELGSLLKDARIVRMWDTLDHRQELLAQHTTESDASATEIASFAFIPHQAVSSHIPRIITVSRDGSLTTSTIMTSDASSINQSKLLSHLSTAGPLSAELSSYSSNPSSSTSTSVISSSRAREGSLPSIGSEAKADFE
ncbi:hypothetical protein FRC09_006066 [Ceratobasidium sp. 395]|nr:hypothetical protein FRC09_006066 [Ceratobasidium sp. 395]